MGPYRRSRRRMGIDAQHFCARGLPIYRVAADHSNIYVYPNGPPWSRRAILRALPRALGDRSPAKPRAAPCLNGTTLDGAPSLAYLGPGTPLPTEGRLSGRIDDD